MFPTLQAEQQARVIQEMLSYLRVEMALKPTGRPLEVHNRIA
jgi:hypothetical protein